VSFDPFLSNDGKRLYFGADGDAGNTDIWFVEKQGVAWGKPQSISPVVNTINGQCQATLTNDGTVYYIDYKTVNNKWTCDILRSRFKNGSYLQPETLPVSINSSSEDWTPYIARDDSYLIFSSTKNKYGDLYISFHDIPADTWSEPINMGGPINTATQETYPTVSPDNKYLFFTRYTNEKSSMDVYWVSAKIIDRLRKNSMKK
jgi:Tol biopolymer transport system component